MTDIFSKSKRSKIMSKIGSKNSSTEMTVRCLIHSMGYRYRLHRKDLPGKPDLVFMKYKKVIFVHGCFWHAHKDCKKSALPSTNNQFWIDKISKNISRDIETYKKLKDIGWDYLIIWQCEAKKKNLENLSKKIKEFLN